MFHESLQKDKPGAPRLQLSISSYMQLRAGQLPKSSSPPPRPRLVPAVVLARPLSTRRSAGRQEAVLPHSPPISHCALTLFLLSLVPPFRYRTGVLTAREPLCLGRTGDRAALGPGAAACQPARALIDAWGVAARRTGRVPIYICAWTTWGAAGRPKSGAFVCTTVPSMILEAKNFPWGGLFKCSAFFLFLLAFEASFYYKQFFNFNQCYSLAIVCNCHLQLKLVLLTDTLDDHRWGLDRCL